MFAALLALATLGPMKPPVADNWRELFASWPGSVRSVFRNVVVLDIARPNCSLHRRHEVYFPDHYCPNGELLYIRVLYNHAAKKQIMRDLARSGYLKPTEVDLGGIMMEGPRYHVAIYNFLCRESHTRFSALRSDYPGLSKSALDEVIRDGWMYDGFSGVMAIEIVKKPMFKI